MTPFDRAHAAMEAAPRDDRARLAVYDRLADAELFILLEREPEDDTITPQVFETEDGDFVLAFDLEERLTAFTGAPAPYAALPGRVIAQYLAGEGVGLGINLGVAASSMLLPPEALDWLTDTLTHAPQAAAGRPAAFHAPALPPGVLGALLPAFEAKFEQLAGLASHALLGGVTYDDGRRGHVLAFLGAPDAAQPGIAKAMAEALAFSGLEAGELDVTFLTPGDPAAEALLAQALVLHLPEPDPEEVQELKPAAPGMDPSRPPILR
ncbi:SseB family protein [Pontitalea aquivivens]|uniref:SseB family protein n=1 Tax=Pontitalea aquivivens TaxID=3388663 RepID=UPI0039704D71